MIQTERYCSIFSNGVMSHNGQCISIINISVMTHIGYHKSGISIEGGNCTAIGLTSQSDRPSLNPSDFLSCGNGQFLVKTL